MSIDFSNLSYDLSHIDPFEAHDEAKRAYEQANRDRNALNPEEILNNILDAYWLAQGNKVTPTPNDHYSSRSWNAGYAWSREYTPQAKQETEYLAAQAKYNAASQVRDDLEAEYLDARKALDLHDLPVGTVIQFRIQTVSEGYSGSYGQYRSAEFDRERGPIIKMTDSNYIVDVGHKTRRVPRDGGTGDTYSRQILVVWGADGHQVEQALVAAEREVEHAARVEREVAAQVEADARFRKEQADAAHRAYIESLQDAVSAAKEAALADLIADMLPVLNRYTRLHLDRLVADLPARQDAP